MSVVSSAKPEITDHGQLWMNVDRLPCRCGLVHPYWTMPVAGRCVPATFPLDVGEGFKAREVRWPEAGMEIYELDQGGDWHLLVLFG